MTIDQVVEARANLEGKFIIFTDASVHLNMYDQYSTFIWDDANELVYMFRVSSNLYTQNIFPYEIESLQYSAIDAMISALDKEKLIKVLDNLKAKGLIDDAKKSEIFNKLKDINNLVPSISQKDLSREY